MIFGKLLPREGNFFELFNQHATWTIVSCYLAIGVGTMFGGWRIVRTMGQKITKLKPVGGFCFSGPARCVGAWPATSSGRGS